MTVCRIGSVSGVLLGILLIHFANAENKWVWSKEHSSDSEQSGSFKKSISKPIITEDELLDLQIKSKKSEASARIDKLFRDELDDDDDDDKYDSKKARYEVNEQYEYVNGKPVSPIRRTSSYPPYSLKRKPALEQYGSSSSGVPIKRQEGSQPALGILTGPVPSWEKPILQKNGDPTKFERCKCTFSFNCKSPGIHFGNCDQGKEYCCYNDFGEGNTNPSASTNIDRYDRLPPIFVGPEGSIDDIRPGFKPHSYNRGERLPPVLAGPGGPVDDIRRGFRPRVPPPPPPSYGIADRIDYDRYDRRHGVPLPQKPVLPPYMGLHNDYRSS